MGHVKIMWSAVCSPAPHSHLAEEAKPHLCLGEPKLLTPVRRRLSLPQAVLVKQSFGDGHSRLDLFSGAPKT